MTNKIWQIGAVFVTAFLFSTMASAQVKEVNALGKKWYLHGIDFRFDPGFVHFYNQDAKLATDLTLQAELRETYNKPNSTYTYKLTPQLSIKTNTASLGVVFRPFFGKELEYLKSIEISHNFGLFNEQCTFGWDSLETPDKFAFYGAQMFSSSYFYNPSVTLSSKTIFNQLKLYGGLDLRFVRPLSNEYYISKNSSKVVYAIDESTITEDNRFDLDYYNLQKSQNGIGYTLGIKGYVTCKWSLHAEFKDLYFRDIYTATKNTYNSRSKQLFIGFRYKFAQPEPQERKSVEGKSVFW
jgi:hypothetical protein